MKSKKPKLLVVDLDGTSLGGGYTPYARFPDHYSAFLDSLAQQGCQWAINTTWGAQGQWELVQRSAVKSRPLFLMAELGMRLWTPGGDGILPVESYNAKMEKAADENNKNSFHAFIKECLAAARPAQMNFYGHWFDMSCAPEDEAAFQKFISSVDWKARGLKKYSSSGCRLAVVHYFLGKDKNLAAAQRIAGIESSETLVAGDEKADIAMMSPQLSAFPLCPGNAAEEVKREALARNGAVGEKTHCDGVMEAFAALDKREGWKLFKESSECIA